MEVTHEKTLSIKVAGDNVDILKGAINKIIANEKKIGFEKSILSNEEIKLLTDIREKL